MEVKYLFCIHESSNEGGNCIFTSCGLQNSRSGLPVFRDAIRPRSTAWDRGTSGSRHWTGIRGAIFTMGSGPCTIGA
jgi:hypothetical protein